MIDQLPGTGRLVLSLCASLIKFRFFLPEMFGDQQSIGLQLLPGLIRSSRLHKFDPRFIKCDAQFKILAVCCFQFDAKGVEPGLPGRDLVASRRQVFAELFERVLLGLLLAKPGCGGRLAVRCGTDSLLLRLSLKIGQKSAFAVDDGFPFIEQTTEPEQLRLPQAMLLTQHCRLMASLLQPQFQFVTGLLQVEACAVEMFALEVQAVFHHRPLFVDGEPVGFAGASPLTLLFRQCSFVLLPEFGQFGRHSFASLLLLGLKRPTRFFQRRGLSGQPFRCGIALGEKLGPLGFVSCLPVG